MHEHLSKTPHPQEPFSVLANSSFFLCLAQNNGTGWEGWNPIKPQGWDHFSLLGSWNGYCPPGLIPPSHHGIQLFPARPDMGHDPPCMPLATLSPQGLHRFSFALPSGSWDPTLRLPLLTWLQPLFSCSHISPGALLPMTPCPPSLASPCLPASVPSFPPPLTSVLPSDLCLPPLALLCPFL